MPIKFVKGNAVSALIDGDIDVLLHVCNNKGVMGSGIALEIKNRVPDAFSSYKQFMHPLGTVSVGVHEFGDEMFTHYRGKVFNMIAQDGYGSGKRFLNYGALADCLKAVASHRSYSGDKIGLPYKMGADRAGGDWEIVLEMVTYFLKDFDVVIYELEGK